MFCSSAARRGGGQASMSCLSTPATIVASSVRAGEDDGDVGGGERRSVAIVPGDRAGMVLGAEGQRVVDAVGETVARHRASADAENLVGLERQAPAGMREAVGQREPGVALDVGAVHRLEEEVAEIEMPV